MDGDGDLDLLIAGGSTGLGLLLNDGAGHFVSAAPTATPLPPHYATAVVAADPNRDREGPCGRPPPTPPFYYPQVRTPPDTWVTA
jgi:hypothetical protein